jgi:hypothetical protein
MKPPWNQIQRWIEWGSIAVALAGLLAMTQPFSVAVYTNGFPVLLVAGLAYISTTFWEPATLTPSRAVVLFVKVLLTLAVVIAVCIALVPILV